MQELILGPVAIWFGVPALVGTAFFTLRLVSMFLGADSDLGADLDVPDLDIPDADVPDMDAAPDVDDSSEAFKVLSVQTLASFAMGFGWGGLGALRGAGWSVAVSVAFGVGCGLAMTWLLARLLRFVYGLQSTGNVPLFHALETEGTVYTSVPAQGDGSGRVRVVIGDRERYYKAVTEGPALPRDTRIRVVEVDQQNSSVKVIEA